MSSTRAFPRLARTARTTSPPLAERPQAALSSTRWLFGFVLLEIACQVALLFDTISVLRVFVRTAAFLGSVMMLLVLRRTGRASHASSGAALVVLAIIALEILHPTTNNFASAFACLFVNIAILGPIFWVPRLKIDVATVRKLFLVYWAFNTVSAVFGVLQLYFPGRFDPAVASILTDNNYVNSLHITLANGDRVFRPMGLTDTPGGAGFGAAYCIVFAVGFLLDRPKPLVRVLLLASVGIACFVLYLCQVRAYLFMTVIALIAMSLPFALQGRFSRYLAMAAVVVGIASIGFVVAVSVGGAAVTSRMSTLTSDDMGTVYYKNRGMFFSYTMDLVPEYPLGAGLGRCGMSQRYFADPSNTESRPLWAEIQWTAWLYDGGVLLMGVYALALIIAWREAVRASAKPNDAPGRDLYKWATVLVGYSVGTVALTFDTAPFHGTMGLDFWVLNAAVFAAAKQLPT